MIVDNRVSSFAFQLDSGISIPTWPELVHDPENDKSLQSVLEVLLLIEENGFDKLLDIFEFTRLYQERLAKIQTSLPPLLPPATLNLLEGNQLESLKANEDVFKSIPPTRFKPLSRILRDQLKNRAVVLGVEGTLVSCGHELGSVKVHFSFRFIGVEYHCQFRPGLVEFLDKAIAHYQIVLFSSDEKAYIDIIINAMESFWQASSLLAHRLSNVLNDRIYEDSCTMVNFSCVKDMRILNAYDVKDIISVDDKHQLDNAIPIKSWTEDSTVKDSSLLVVLGHLKTIQSLANPTDEIIRIVGLRRLVENILNAPDGE